MEVELTIFWIKEGSAHGESSPNFYLIDLLVHLHQSCLVIARGKCIDSSPPNRYDYKNL